MISSEVWLNGKLKETVTFPHSPGIKYEEAVSLLKQAHSEKKKEIELLMGVFRRTLTEGNSNSLTHLGTAFFYKQFFLEARELFSKAIELNPKCHQAFNYLGQTELALGQKDEAVRMLHRAAQQKPEYADYRNHLGFAFHAQGAFDRAIAEFEQAINLNLYYADAYFNLGLVLLDKALQQNKAPSFAEIVTKSTGCFKKALLIYPDYDSILFEEATIAVNNSDLSKAIELFSRINKKKQDRHRREFLDFHMKYALDPEMISADTLQERIRYLEQQIKKNPTYVDLRSDLSQCYLKLAYLLWEKGIKQYSETVGLNPSLGKLAFCQNEAEKELVSLRNALDRMAEKG